jgi:hypothetical protein
MCNAILEMNPIGEGKPHAPRLFMGGDAKLISHFRLYIFNPEVYHLNASE